MTGTVIRFISVPQTARLLHFSEESVRRRCMDGRIVAVRCGHIWRIRADLLGGAA